MAAGIQQRIRDEIGLSASIGIAGNKLVAKVASDYRKPYGLTLVPRGGEAAFLAPLEIERLYGVGKVTARRLRALGIQTIGDSGPPRRRRASRPSSGAMAPTYGNARRAWMIDRSNPMTRSNRSATKRRSPAT